MCVAEGEVGEGDEHEPGDLVTAGVGGGAAVEAGLALQSHTLQCFNNANPI